MRSPFDPPPQRLGVDARIPRRIRGPRPGRLARGHASAAAGQPPRRAARSSRRARPPLGAARCRAGSGRAILEGAGGADA
ncbi:hypothetical protein OJF2_00590 [Aquisphaera giovannonii]|uniref:Uncharacterized protein n=1 Tax=Aquisphaera giovannonii TaxID=406548 RepID=A0A5B9VTZ1_9BACT|nr:hypothetical protein OJF2_00590 [Aquisphaera giovannonii]